MKNEKIVLFAVLLVGAFLVSKQLNLFSINGYEPMMCSAGQFGGNVNTYSAANAIVANPQNFQGFSFLVTCPNLQYSTASCSYTVTPAIPAYFVTDCNPESILYQYAQHIQGLPSPPIVAPTPTPVTTIIPITTPVTTIIPITTGEGQGGVAPAPVSIPCGSDFISQIICFITNLGKSIRQFLGG